MLGLQVVSGQTGRGKKGRIPSIPSCLQGSLSQVLWREGVGFLLEVCGFFFAICTHCIVLGFRPSLGSKQECKKGG